jgi:hypothetical protein
MMKSAGELMAVSTLEPPSYHEIFKARMAIKQGKLPPVGRQAFAAKPQTASIPQDYFSFGELAQRWRCSRATVYNRLRALGVKVLDFSPRGKRSRKAISLATVLEIENRQSKRLQ